MEEAFDFDPGEGCGASSLDAGMRQEFSGVSGVQRKRGRLPSLLSPASSPGSVVESMSLLADDEQPRVVVEGSDIVAHLSAQVDELQQELDAALKEKAEADLALLDSIAARKVAQARAEEFKRRLDLKGATDDFVEAERNFLRAQVSKLIGQLEPASEECGAQRCNAEEDVAEYRQVLAALKTDIDRLRVRKEKLSNEVHGLEVLERDVEDCSMGSAKDALVKRIQEENGFLKSRVGQLEEDLDSSLDEVASLEEQVVGFSERERALKDKLKATMGSLKQLGDLGSVQCVHSGSGEENTDVSLATICESEILDAEDGSSLASSEELDNESCQAGKCSRLIQAQVAGFHGLCAEIREKLEDSIENVEALIQCTQDLPDGKPDISYTVEEDLLDIAELNGRMHKEWSALHGLLLEAGQEDEGCDWSCSSQSESDGDDVSDDTGPKSNRHQGELGDGSETEEEECDKGVVLQGIESPISTSSESDAGWDGSEGVSGSGCLFNSEVDDICLPCAWNPIPIWKRPEQVPKLDFFCLDGDVDAMGKSLKLVDQQPSLTPQSRFNDAPSLALPLVQVQFTQTDGDPVEADIQSLKRENELVRSTVDALLQEKSHGIAALEAAQFDICVLRSEVLRKDEEKKCLYSQLEQAQAENLRLNQNVEGLTICKEVLVKEVEDARMNVVGLSQRINQGIVENAQLGCSLQTIHAQLAEAKACIGALQASLDKSESEKYDLEWKLEEANRQCLEAASVAMCTTMANGRLSRQLEDSKREPCSVEECSHCDPGPSAGSGSGDSSVGVAARGIHSLGEIVHRVESEQGSRPATPFQHVAGNRGGTADFQELQFGEVAAAGVRRWIRIAALGAVGFSLCAAARKWG